MSLFECRQMAFKNNQRVNPETGRKITVGGEIHQMLVKKYLTEKVSPTKHKIQKLSPKTIKPKVSPIPVKLYEIHHNGVVPFTVIVEGKKVSIYKNKKINNIPPILKYNTDEIFIGKSPKNAETTFSGNYGPKFDGNTILIKVKDKYIYIGKTIFSFTSLSPIVRYVSPVGNNDVPYPYAMDENNNAYLMLDKIIMLENKSKDPYTKYYKSTSEYPKYKGVIVNEWVVNNKSTIFHNTNDPSANYDRLTKYGTQPMYIIDKNGKSYKLTKKDYTMWVNGFNHQHQYKPLKNKLLV